MRRGCGSNLHQAIFTPTWKESQRSLEHILLRRKSRRSVRAPLIMSSSTVEVAKPAPGQQVKRRTDGNAARFWTSAALTLIAIGLGFGFWAVSRQLAPEIITPSTSAEETNSALAPQKSIAVLPFENLSENDKNAFLADGVQDDILTALSKVADMKVIS